MASGSTTIRCKARLRGRTRQIASYVARSIASFGELSEPGELDGLDLGQLLSLERDPGHRWRRLGGARPRFWRAVLMRCSWPCTCCAMTVTDDPHNAANLGRASPAGYDPSREEDLPDGGCHIHRPFFGLRAGRRAPGG
jgi:hypothetical protein